MKKKTIVIIAFFLFFPEMAMAGAYPWMETITAIQGMLQSGILKAICVTLICISGYLLASGETNGILKRFIQMALGCSIMTGAASLVTALFPLAK